MFKHVVVYLFVFSEGTGFLVCDEWHITATVSLFPIFSLGTRVVQCFSAEYFAPPQLRWRGIVVMCLLY
jgi:hypothetical protein